MEPKKIYEIRGKDNFYSCSWAGHHPQMNPRKFRLACVAPGGSPSRRRVLPFIFIFFLNENFTRGNFAQKKIHQEKQAKKKVGMISSKSLEFKVLDPN